VIRAVVALCVEFLVLVAEGKHLLMLCSPMADTRLVLTSGAAATLLTWVAGGIAQRRLTLVHA
jgi:hypothetical protein